MARDPYVVLGLPFDCSDPRQIAASFQRRRARLLSELDDPTRHDATRHALDELYLAYMMLRDPRRRAAHLQARAAGDAVAELREQIAAALEDGLLRYTRRQAILQRAAELGIGEFQAQLLIAQVQFGGEDIDVVAVPVASGRRAEPPRLWARAAGVGVLALAMFLGLIHWLGV